MPSLINVQMEALMSHFLKWKFPYLSFTVILSLFSAGFAATYYVSPSGDDSRSGTESEPFGTLHKARDVLRTVSNEPKTVYIMPGNYFLDEPLAFDERDGGTEQNPVLWKGISGPGGELPAVYGGTRIEGWQQSGKPNIYKANVGSADWVFWSVSENGKRSQNARHPNYPQGKPGLINQYVPYRCYDQNGSGIRTSNNFYYKAGEFPDQWDYANVRLTTSPGWFTDVRRVSNVDFAARKITTDPAFKDGSHYWLEGSVDFIDGPGEWALDDQGYIHYWPKALPIEEQVIVAGKMLHVVEFKGSSPSNPVQYITVEGILISTSDNPTEHYSSKTSPSCPTNECHENNCENDEMRHGLVHFENAEHCAVRFCKIWNAGVMGVCLNYHAQHNTVYGNWIEGVNHYGVYLCSYCVSDGPWDRINAFNTITNNYINDYGKLMSGVAGVGMYQSSDNVVTHNEIRKAPRYAISIKGQYTASLPAGQDQIISERNIMSHNDVSHAAFQTEDVGAIEFWWPGRGCKLFYNLIHDLYHLNCPVHGEADTRFNCNLSQRHCIYPDAGITPCKVGDDSVMVNVGWNGVDIVNWYVVGGQPIPLTRSAAKSAAARAGFDIDDAGLLSDFPWHTPGQDKLEYEWPCEMVWDTDLEDEFMAAHFTNGDGLDAAYYSSSSLSGTPNSTKIEPYLGLSWGGNTNVRLTGWIVPIFTEEYRFGALPNGNVKIWIDNSLVIDGSGNGRQNLLSDFIPLNAHQAYPIKIEFTAGRLLAVDWFSPTQPIQVIPQSQLFSGAAPPDITTGANSTARNIYMNTPHIVCQPTGITVTMDRTAGYRIAVMTLDGKTIVTKSGSGTMQHHIPSRHFSGGVYIVKVAQGTSITVNRVVVQR
ncbi:MAG: hypothetical protein GF350_01000 [Chitinivibrionales bacterium]|nr:hypothetical protein [Chitinivibrionales bacterium]